MSLLCIQESPNNRVITRLRLWHLTRAVNPELSTATE
jgi:hypothetical protein